MIQLLNTRLYKSLFETLAAGVAIQEEGIAMVFVKENGETKVQPSTGAAGEIFAGLALARNLPPSTLPFVEELVGELEGTFTRAPIAGQVNVRIKGGASLDIVTNPAATPTATEIVISGSTYKLHADNEGAALVAQYLYTPTVQEARMVIGDAPYGGLAANAMGKLACVKQGEVATSFFDASADWSTTMYARLGANGRFIPGTASNHLNNVVVKNAPSVGSPFLALEINIA